MFRQSKGDLTMKKSNPKVTDNSTLHDFALTELYGKTAIDYVNSPEYQELQQKQKELDEEFLDSVQTIDSDCQDARDALYMAYGLLEKKKIDSQAAAHADTNLHIENLAHRELSMMEVLNAMLKENQIWLEEVL